MEQIQYKNCKAEENLCYFLVTVCKDFMFSGVMVGLVCLPEICSEESLFSRVYSHLSRDWENKYET